MQPHSIAGDLTGHTTEDRRPHNRVTIFQRDAIAKAASAGAEMFLGVPDVWYEPQPSFGCDNGHVSRRYLVSEEHGSLCLACYQPVLIIPQGHTDASLLAELNKVEQAGTATHGAEPG